jgi:hypothetical protein
MRRRRSGSGWDFIDFPDLGDDPISAIIAIVMLAIVAVVLVVFAGPAVIAALAFLVDSFLIGLAALGTLLGALLFRRPWVLSARTREEPVEQRDVQVVGWLASRRALEALRGEIETGQPSPVTLAKASIPRQRRRPALRRVAALWRR